MKLFRVSVVQCRGTAYEIGRAQARMFAATPKGPTFLRRKSICLPWWKVSDAQITAVNLFRHRFMAAGTTRSHQA